MSFNLSLKACQFVVLLSGLSFIAPNQARAQQELPSRTSDMEGRNEFVGSYIISLATASTHDFVSNASFLGFGLDWGHYLSNRASIGFNVRWHRFYQEDDRETHEIENAAITGKQYKLQSMLPLFPRIKFDLGSGESNIVPYVQLGLGPMYGQKYLTIGNFNSNNFGWQFGFAPEVGVYVRTGYGSTGALFSVRYDAGLGTDAFPAYSAFNFSIGLRQTL